MRYLLLLPGLLLPACYIQNRDLERRVGSGCHSERECTELLEDIRKAGCGVGSQQCETQREQFSIVEALVKERRAEAREAAAAEASRARIRHAEEERARLAAEKLRQDAADKARNSVQARARLLAEWEERVAQICATGREDPCRNGPMFEPTEDETASCRSACRASLVEHADQVERRALGECLRRGADACEFPESVRSELASRATECGKSCVQLQKEAKQFPDLVRQYERCMLAADRSPEARKLEPYSAAMYNRFLRTAEERCRKSSQCDRVERHPDFHCSWER